MKKDHSYWIIPFFKNNDWSIDFLLINQKSDFGSFRWFPKWHPEWNETPLESAKRELFEEVWIKEIEIIWNQTFEISYICRGKDLETLDKTVTFFVWETKDKNITIQQEELNWYKWADFNSAQWILTHNNYKKLLQDVKNFLN